MSHRSPTRRELARRRVVYLLDLEWGGNVYRLASEQIDVLTDAGDSLSYDASFEDPEFAVEANSFATSADDLSVSLEMVLPGVDVAERVFSGFPLEAAQGELSFVLVDNLTGEVGQTWEERFELLSGHLDRPRFGDPEQDPGYLRTSLENRPFDRESTIIPTTARIGPLTHDNFTADSLGASYPLVFGISAGLRDGAAIRATPGYKLKWSLIDGYELLIAYGRVAGPTVTVFDDSGNSAELTVEHATDKIGQTYAYVIVTGAGLSVGDEEFWVSWCYTSGGSLVGAGGLLRLDGEGPIAGAGDLSLWGWSRTNADIDHQSWRNAAGILNRYAVAGYIGGEDSSDVRFWEWFKAEILPLVPMIVIPGPRGLAVVPLDLQHAEANIVADIIEGPDFYRTGAIAAEKSKRDFYNVVSLDYSHDPVQGKYGRQARVGEQFVVVPWFLEGGQLPLHHAAMSVENQTEGLIERAFASTFLYGEASANLIAEELLRRGTAQVYLLTFDADDLWGDLEIGDAVYLTDAGAHLQDQLCWVTGRAWAGDRWRYRLYVMRDQVTDRQDG